VGAGRSGLNSPRNQPSCQTDLLAKPAETMRVSTPAAPTVRTAAPTATSICHCRGAFQIGLSLSGDRNDLSLSDMRARNICLSLAALSDLHQKDNPEKGAPEYQRSPGHTQATPGQHLAAPTAATARMVDPSRMVTGGYEFLAQSAR
jgi:hypothetical protein